MLYIPSQDRYQTMTYNQCGKSGLLLPAISLGLWHNFGHESTYATARAMVTGSFDRGITHFDLANNYGPPPGSAEETFCKILQSELKAYRDELIISTKAGYRMWPGPYGEWGSRKNLIASLDQSLQRMGLDYVDIYYSHRPDESTPLEETIGALASTVKQGKALYVGISSYSADQTKAAARIGASMGVPLLIHQPSYSLFNRWIEPHLLDALAENGMGCIAFSPLAQGLLTDRYQKGIPTDSRAGKPSGFLRPDHVTTEKIRKADELRKIAAKRNQSLAQMSLSWALRDRRMTSVIIGASRMDQINENIDALKNREFSTDELSKIDAIVGK